MQTALEGTNTRLKKKHTWEVGRGAEVAQGEEGRSLQEAQHWRKPEPCRQLDSMKGRGWNSHLKRLKGEKGGSGGEVRKVKRGGWSGQIQEVLEPTGARRGSSRLLNVKEFPGESLLWNWQLSSEFSRKGPVYSKATSEWALQARGGEGQKWTFQSLLFTIHYGLLSGPLAMVSRTEQSIILQLKSLSAAKIINDF